MAIFKTEPGYTPRPARTTWRELPALGHHATFLPGTSRVQKKKQKQKQKKRPQYQPLHSMESMDSLTPEEQVYELKKSRKAIKSKLYGKIARLQVCLIAITHR
jgi:hypothetical protein